MSTAAGSTLRIRPRTAAWAVLMPMLLLGVGCGPHPVAQADQSAAPAAGTTPAVPEPVGPFDQDHRDEAIALARRALQKKLGDVVLRKPTAQYMHTRVKPQLPGQPETPVAIGWMVSFLVSPGSDSQVQSDQPAAGAPVPAPVDQQSAPLSGRPQIDLVRQSMPSPGPIRPDRNPGQGPGQGGPPPNALDALTPPPVHITPMIQPGPDSTPTASRHGIFVAVDGTVTPL